MQILQKIVFVLLLVVACAALSVLSVHFEERRSHNVPDPEEKPYVDFRSNKAEMVFTNPSLNYTQKHVEVKTNSHINPLSLAQSSYNTLYQLPVSSARNIHSSGGGIAAAGSKTASNADAHNVMKKRIVENTGSVVLPRIRFTSTSALLAVNTSSSFAGPEENTANPRHRLPGDDPGEPMTEPLGEPSWIFIAVCLLIGLKRRMIANRKRSHIIAAGSW